MDLGNLCIFIHACKKYKKRVAYIEIENTSNIAGYFNNFYYKAILKPVRHLPDLLKNNEYNKYAIKRLNAINNINKEINTWEGKIKVECVDEYDAISKLRIVYENIKRYSEISEIKASYKGNEIKNGYFSELENIIIKDKKTEIYKNALDGVINDVELLNKIRDEVVNDAVGSEVITKYFTIETKLNKILETIKNKKNLYLINKLVSHELTREEVNQYPDLIDAYDNLIKIKAIIGCLKL
jgi:hypothetical protein